MFKLASLVVDITARDSAFSRSLAGIRTSMTATAKGLGGMLGGAFGVPLRAVGALGDAVVGIGKGLALGGVAAAVGGMTAAVYRGVTGAVELQDVMSATDAIFGESSGIIKGWADRMAADFGAVRTETVNAAQGFGAAFKAIGMGTDESATLGTELAKLGMDMASFKGTSNAEAFTALSAALRGEFDPLERFNVMLSAAAIGEEAVRMGLAKNAHQLDENAKKQATLSLIMRKSVDMQGDLERTADQTGNQWKKFSGTLVNTATDIGTVFLPAITSILTIGSEAMVGLSGLFKANRGTFEGWSASIVGLVGDVGVVWRNLGDVWEIVTLKASAGLTNFLNVLAVIPENIGIIAGYIAENWYQLIYDGVSASIAIFQNFGENLKRVVEAVIAYMRDPTAGFHVDFVPILEGFEATAAKFPELTKPVMIDVQDQIAAVQDRISERESAHLEEQEAKKKAKEAAGLPAKGVAEEVASAKVEKIKTSSAEDYYMKLREASLGAKDNIPKQQLAEQKRTREASEKTAKILSKGVPATLG